MANDATIHIAVSRTAVCFAEITAADCAMPSRPHRDARMLKEDKHSVRQWVSLSINPREHSTSQLLSEAARNTSLSVTWLAFSQNAFAAVRQTDRLYRDFSTQIPNAPAYFFTLHFRHEVLHGERAASTCKPNFRHVRRERLPQASLTTKVFAKYHSHPLAARMTLVCLCEDESFVQRSSVPFIFILNGLP